MLDFDHRNLYLQPLLFSSHHDRSPSVTSSYHFNFDKEGHLIFDFQINDAFFVMVLKGTEN